MLIAFDQLIWRTPGESPIKKDEPRPTQIIHLNPQNVLSVNRNVETRGQLSCCVTMDNKNEDEVNDEWVVLGEADHIAGLINLGCSNG